MHVADMHRLRVRRRRSFDQDISAVSFVYSNSRPSIIIFPARFRPIIFDFCEFSVNPVYLAFSEIFLIISLYSTTSSDIWMTSFARDKLV